MRYQAAQGNLWDREFLCGFGALVVACVLLPKYFGFRLNRATFFENKEAIVVAAFAVLAAVVTEGHDLYFKGGLRLLRVSLTNSYFRQRMLSSISETIALYIELTAFVPAVWMVCRKSNGGGQQSDALYRSDKGLDAHVAETRQRAVVFFAFLIGFYFTEDMVSAFSLWRTCPLAALGHTAHYLLFLDIAGFFLANLYDPQKLEKLMGSMLNMLADSCAV